MADDNTTQFGSVIDFSQDISTAEAPPPLPARTYLGTCTGAEQKQSQKGSMYAAVEFTIAPDQFPPDFAAVQKDAVKLIFRRVPLSDDMRSRYQLRKFGEAMRVSLGRRVDLNDFIGKSANLKIGESEYNGEKRAEIQAVEPA
jgi:hypothetical protein